MGGNKRVKPWGSKLTDEEMAAVGLRFKEQNPDRIEFGYARMRDDEIQVSRHAMQRMFERDTPLIEALSTRRAVVVDQTIVTVLPRRARPHKKI